ncbi:hypothetical protein MUP05_11450 [Candidatus Bathyarchaeota archaeon]|nr:hypothetical protein [Candidatus Bathyarchaeota archaeon]
MNNGLRSMSCKPIFLIAILGLVILTSSISEIHGYKAGRYLTCQNVTGAYQPVGITDTFAITDTYVCVWFELEDTISGTKYPLTVKYYQPGLKYYGEAAWYSVAYGTHLIDYSRMQIAGAEPSNIPGQWKASLFVGYEWAFDKTFTIGTAAPPTKTFSVMLDTDPKVTTVILDGNAIPAGTSMDFKEGETHVISVKDTVEKAGETGVRYVFKEWSDGIAERTRTIKVFGPATYTAIFTTQWYLKVESDFGEVKGEGWYNKGTQAVATLDMGRVGAGFLEDWVFKGWTGGASGTDLKSKPILMDGPKTATAQWEKQFSVVFYVVVVVVLVLVILIAIFIMMKRGILKLSTRRSRALPPPPPPPPPQTRG